MFLRFRVGVAIAFMVKTEKKGKTPAQIFYTRRPEFELATDKLDFLRSTKFADISNSSTFSRIQNIIGLNITHNDWDEFIPVASKADKSVNPKEPKAIFELFSLGVSTNRDEWVYDDSHENLGTENQVFH